MPVLVTTTSANPAPDEDEPRPTLDLGLLFTTNARDLAAIKIFVNREPQRVNFDQSVHAHWASIQVPDFRPAGR